MSASLTFIGNQFGIYAGFSIFIFGIIGNVINIYLLFPTRSNSCSFLLFVSSFSNIMALLVGLLPKVLIVGFDIDPSTTSMIWCKSRLCLSYTATITSLTCVCFASFDRFCASCRSITWGNRSKLSTAKIAILIAIPLIISINVPYIIFSTIVEEKTSTNDTTPTCSVINPSFLLYLDYFIRPVLIGLLPCIILSITRGLTYRNVTSITNVQQSGIFQRGLTSMILLQIITIIIPIAPFAIMNIYQVITSSTIKTTYRLAQETLILNITNIIVCISYASNFYVYLISASLYRRDFLRLILCRYRQNHWNNRIEPATRK